MSNHHESFQDILTRQGFNTDLGPEDVTMEWIPFPKGSWRKSGGWFAIPKEIVAFNPLESEPKVGRLLPNGAFVGHQVDFGDPLHPSKIEARAMIFGKSVVRDFCRIGKGTIISNAKIERAVLGENVIVDSEVFIFGGNPFPRPIIGNDVIIGSNSSVSFHSKIGNNVSIGENVMITDSVIGDEVVLESADPSDPCPPYSRFRGRKTFIGRSLIENEVKVAANATIENSTIAERAVIGRSAIIENSHIDQSTVIPEGDKRFEERSKGYGRLEQESNQNISPSDLQSKPKRPMSPLAMLRRRQ